MGEFLTVICLSALSPVCALAAGNQCPQAFSIQAQKQTHLQTESEEWRPPNAVPESRWQGAPSVRERPAEVPSYMLSKPQRHGVVFGPNEKFQAAFNPAAWTTRDKSGREKIMMVIRGEENRNDADWKRHSLPYLAESYDGIHFTLVSKDPILTATEWYEEKGGTEDPRYFDMRLSPYRDPNDGKTFDGALFYVAYDGSTARIAVAVFNHSEPTILRKLNLLFDPKEVSLNPLVPVNPEWNKSPGAIQYRDPESGRVRNVIYVGEGNTHHGGIMALESDSPLNWNWANKEPALKAKANTYTSNLIEIAYPPVIGRLSHALARKTGETYGIYVQLHGDAPPRGYQVGYAIFSLKNPTGAPIYESKTSFMWPEADYEIRGQVDRVVFASGSATLGKKRFIYYGGADSVIGAMSMDVEDLPEEIIPRR